MRETIFKLLSVALPQDQDNMIRLVTKSAKSEYDASSQLAQLLETLQNAIHVT